MTNPQNVRFFFADNLQRIRKEKNITYEEIAEYIGVTVSAVRQYEKALKLPAVDKIFEIANCLKVSVNALIGDNDFSDLPNVAKIVEEKIFEYRLQRAMDFLRNAKCNVIRYKGTISITVPIKHPKRDEEGKIKFICQTYDAQFADEISLVELVEEAEQRAINSTIALVDALGEIIEHEYPYDE